MLLAHTELDIGPSAQLSDFSPVYRPSHSFSFMRWLSAWIRERVCDCNYIACPTVVSYSRSPLVTFEIQVDSLPHKFFVHLKGGDRNNTLLCTTKFSTPEGTTDLEDLQFFKLYDVIIRDRIVEGMFTTDLSDFFCVQLVPDTWHPCGDFA